MANQIKKEPEKYTIGYILRVVLSAISILTVIIGLVTSYNNLSNGIAINKTANEFNALSITKVADDLTAYKNKREQIDLRIIASIESVEDKVNELGRTNATVIERVGNVKSQITSLKRDYYITKKQR